MHNILKLIKAKLAARNSVDGILTGFHKHLKALAKVEEEQRRKASHHQDQFVSHLAASDAAFDEARRSAEVQKKFRALIG